MIKVRVLKNGNMIGWFKDIQPGVNNIIQSCRVNGFSISDYTLEDFDGNVVWRGSEYVSSSESSSS